MRHTLLLILSLSVGLNCFSQKAQIGLPIIFDPDSVLKLMYRVNGHFAENAWKQNDRNWIRATYYTGLMAFYQVTNDSIVLNQMMAWGQKHGWKTGSEWIYPANRLTCSQTWIQLYQLDQKPYMIENTRAFMDKRIERNEHAFDAGWDYVDALYVGAPAYFKMSEITGDSKYKIYADRIFREVTDQLYDTTYHLYFRDLKAKLTTSENGKPEFWSRGNGWAFAAITKILTILPESDPMTDYYKKFYFQMAESLAQSQGKDGFWRSSLLDPDDYPDPESSGTAFFTYGLAWGINTGILERESYLPVLIKSWDALYHAVDENGKVCRGQDVARAPGNVSKSDSREFVSGAFLLAASEVYKLSLNQFKKE